MTTRRHGRTPYVYGLHASLAFKVLVAVIAIGLVTLAYGDCHYVDCSLSDYSNSDGSSWEKAFKTIQEGVDAAETGDVVLVAPGWYDEGGAAIDKDPNGAALTNRVCIQKCITVRSRDGRATRDSTFIVGRHATNPDDPSGMGMGLDAVRCVRIGNNTYGAVLEGFTLINGATHYYGGTHKAWSAGGGAFFGKLSQSHEQSSYLVDCVISNCVSPRGGGMYYGNAVRCRFTGNYSSENSTAVRDGNLYWCVLDGNYGADSVAYLGGSKAVNCTFVNAAGGMFRGNSTNTLATVLNTVVLSYKSKTTAPYVALTNCVLSEDCEFRAYNLKGEHATNKCMSVGMNSVQFVSSATGDWRPLASGNLVGTGDAEHLAYIPEQYRYTDYEGKEVSSSGSITVGAYSVPVEPQGGLTQFIDASSGRNYAEIKVNGYEFYAPAANAYSYSMDDSLPHVYELEYVMPDDLQGAFGQRSFYGFSANYTNTVAGGRESTVYYSPVKNTNKVHMFAPPKGGILKVAANYAEYEIWADASVEDGAEMDGTNEKPYNTLQGAVEAAMKIQFPSGMKKYVVIKAKPGRYDKGGMMWGGVSNRVAVTSTAAYVRLLAEEGPENTFIVGAEDPNSTHPYKYGPAAVRCYGSSTGVAMLNGFTLTGGRVSINPDGTENDSGDLLYGGGIYSTASAFAAEDCVMTNCVASRGSIAYGCVLRRCLAVDCTSTWIGALRGNVHASACVFKDINLSHVIGQDERAYNCTFISNHGLDTKVTGNSSSDQANGIYNSIAYGFYSLTDTPQFSFVGSYYDRISSVDSAVKNEYEGMNHTLIGFADPATYDYSPYSVSQVVNGGDTRNLDDEYWRYASATDINGIPFDFRADGTVTAGAFATTVPSCAVNASATEGVAAVSVFPAGDRLVAGNAPVTFTADAAGTRNFQGFYLNGELVSTESTYTLAYDDAFEGQNIQLEAKYSPYWYVDSTKSDSNSGRSWGEAKRSLAEVMKLALPGDTVYAEAGVYDIGDMIQHENSYKADPILRARVVLTNGVSLVSRRGPEQTFIMGAAATNPDQFGCGAGALRCVYMYPDTRLEGFTLTGGRDLGQGIQDDNNRGGGVHGWMKELSLVKDCIISNNVASRGGGATHVTAVNCRFLENRGYHSCAATQHAFHHNCYFDYNVSGTATSGGYIVGYWRGLRNCTIGKNNYLSNNALGPSSENNVQHPQAYNTLVLAGKVYNVADYSKEGYSGVFTNCAFTTEALNSWPASAIYDEKTIFADPSQLQVDENGVPIPGKNVAIDAGDIQYVDPLYSATDLAGNPRAVNGLRMDIGCYEADWKNRYASSLGSRLSVSEASPAVYETDSRTVALVDDTKVTIDLIGSGTRVARQSVSFKVVGAGVLTLKIDGETHEFADTGAVQTFVSNSKAALRKFEFSFAGTGRAELVNCSSGVGMSFVIR